LFFSLVLAEDPRRDGDQEELAGSGV